jgi:Metallopeptidase family M24
MCRMEKVYAALHKAQQAAIAALHPGARLSAAYDAAKSTLADAGGDDLAAKLGKNVGFATHLELREAKLQLAPGSEAEVKEGMVFNVSVGVAGLENAAAESSKDKCAQPALPRSRLVPRSIIAIRQSPLRIVACKGIAVTMVPHEVTPCSQLRLRRRQYAVQIADSVLVKAAGAEPELLTRFADAAWESVSYEITEDADDDSAVASDDSDIEEVGGSDDDNGRRGPSRCVMLPPAFCASSVLCDCMARMHRPCCTARCGGVATASRKSHQPLGLLIDKAEVQGE